ncbi:MAG: aminotransferase class I/II-fold pyridoxal phosphate-dependent enzyme [Prevotella sp.]|nr:aminotransferase class I/II-fold pyridoxal phosphate-dependent enzyme [Prevotella sp.]
MIEYLSLKKITAMHSDEIQEAVYRVVASGWYLLGQAVKQFEQEYAAYIGTRHCISCANGLDALTLILRAYMEMGIMKPGDEVIVPANTYIATILSITENRLKPILVEPCIDTLQIDDSRIEEVLTTRTRAIMLVNLYGKKAYTERIGKLCQQHHLLLFEDCAQSHGISVEGDAQAHSFYPGKNLGALGDAGAVTTDDDKLADVIRALANYGSSRKYVFPYRGRNSRMDEIQAAVLSVKLKYLDEDNAHRKDIAAYYHEHIQHPDIYLPNGITSDCVYHIFPVLCERRDELMAYMKEKGVETVIHYPIPPHRQECYKEWHEYSLPVTELIHQRELSLPCNPAMTQKEVEYVCSVINTFPSNS